MKRLQNFTFKKMAMTCVMFLLSMSLFAQSHIDLNPSNAKGVQSSNMSMKGFNATFSINSIEAGNVNTEKGVFSILSFNNSIPSGEAGSPQLPVIRELLAVPFGSTPVVTIKNYTTKEYKLSEYGIEKVYPNQPSVRKDINPEDVEFVYNAASYNARSYNERPIAEVEVLGTMRGIQIGTLQVNPVSYNPSNNTIRVYNDIEVEVTFNDADIQLTENTLINTFSPYFSIVYQQLFNNRAIQDVYDDHPDLWMSPVKMLVIANRMFEESMQPWIEWKTMKGIYLDVNYTDEIGTSSADIKQFIKNKYDEGVAAGQAPTFVVIFGDEDQVAPSTNSASETHMVSDLYYGTVDDDYFPDMYYSRMSAETTAQMDAIINKILVYEQYTMPDPSYLNNVLLIAGADSYWNPLVAQPTINYATNYYFNEEHGFDNVYAYLNNYTGCYEHLNTGVGFANYTAHGGYTSWADPSFTVNDVHNLTNTGKYFWAMGNCCIAGNWGYSSECFAEAMIRAEEKAAFGYIGSVPNTYWYEDYYFGVGATSQVNGQMPLYENTTMGTYDAMWIDGMYNTLSSTAFVGNLAVCYATESGYEISVGPLYYWEAYHVFGDGSVMPYRTQPVVNDVSHLPTLPIGVSTYSITAAPGSYVGISKDGILYGAGMIDETGTTEIPLTPITSGGDVNIVVTHPQYEPYIVTVPAAALDGPYIVCKGVDLKDENQQADYGETLSFDMVLENVGTETANNMTVTLSTESEYVELLNSTASVATIENGSTYTIEGVFDLSVNVNVPDKESVVIYVNVTDGTDVWESRFTLTLHAPKLNINAISATANLAAGSEGVMTIELANNGTSPAYNIVADVFSAAQNIEFETISYTVEVLAAGETAVVEAPFRVSDDTGIGSMFEVAVSANAGHYGAEASYQIMVGAIADDFETGDFSKFDWTFENYDWTIDNENYHSGTYSARSAQISNSQTTSMKVSVEVLAEGEFSYYYKVSSEENYDVLLFYIDGNLMDEFSGSIDWRMATYTVTPGIHEFKWTYSKDGSVSSGEDCAWVDDVKLPASFVVLSLDPVTNLTADVEGNTVDLTWTGIAEAAHYLVYRNGEQVSEQSSTTFSEALADGIYTYTVVAVNNEGVMSRPASVTVNVGTVDVIEIEEIQFSVYPNPVNGILNINADACYEYSMMNSLGQVVMKGVASGSEQLNVSALEQGVYFLRLVVDKNVIVKKILVK